MFYVYFIIAPNAYFEINKPASILTIHPPPPLFVYWCGENCIIALFPLSNSHDLFKLPLFSSQVVTDNKSFALFQKLKEK